MNVGDIILVCQWRPRVLGSLIIVVSIWQRLALSLASKKKLSSLFRFLHLSNSTLERADCRAFHNSTVKIPYGPTKLHLHLKAKRTLPQSKGNSLSLCPSTSQWEQHTTLQWGHHNHTCSKLLDLYCKHCNLVLKLGQIKLCVSERSNNVNYFAGLVTGGNKCLKLGKLNSEAVGKRWQKVVKCV